MTFTEEETASLFTIPNPGKPHIANLMMEKNYAADKKEAMKWLNEVQGKEFITPEKAVKAIMESGGVPVLAHAIFGDGRSDFSDEEVEARVKHLKEIGIEGLECFYSEYDERQEQMMLSLAEKYGLMATGGSDYHGKNKDVSIGQHGLTEEKMHLPAVRKFMERCF